MSSGREFQILGHSVRRLFSPNVAVFVLLTAKSLFLLAECEAFKFRFKFPFNFQWPFNELFSSDVSLWNQ